MVDPGKHVAGEQVALVAVGIAGQDEGVAVRAGGRAGVGLESGLLSVAMGVAAHRLIE